MILYALQVCPLDANAAAELSYLLADIEPDRDPRHEILLSYRWDTPVDRIFLMKKNLERKFFVHGWRSDRQVTGWPDGSNALWLSTMDCVNQMRDTQDTKAEGVLTFEPDCVPARSDWMEILDKAYDERGDKLIVGNLHQCEGQFDHINGNGIFPTDLLNKWPHIRQTPYGSAWDYYHRDLFLSIALDTPYIMQMYRKTRLLPEEWKLLSKHGQRPALLHGVKDASARRLARAELVSAKRTVRQPWRPMLQGVS